MAGSKLSKFDSGSWLNELTIRFEDGSEEYFFIELTKSGTFVVPENSDEASWTSLDFFKCPCCPLSSEEEEFCPAAESIESTLLRLKSRFSYEKVSATIIDGAKRATTVNWQLQEVGSTFVQLAVFSSGCPVGRRLKPLIRDLRPFATNDELSKHLITKFLLKHKGNVKECQQDILEKMDPLRTVFSNLSKRLSQVITGDAIANSIVRLDAFALNVSLLMDEVLEEVKQDMDWQSEGTVMSPIDSADLDSDLPSSDESSENQSKSKKSSKGLLATIVTAFKNS